MKFTVNDKCIDCGVCYKETPNHFSFDGCDGALVWKQPQDDVEVQACIRAKEDCPMGAIDAEL